MGINAVFLTLRNPLTKIGTFVHRVTIFPLRYSTMVLLNMYSPLYKNSTEKSTFRQLMTWEIWKNVLTKKVRDTEKLLLESSSHSPKI